MSDSFPENREVKVSFSPLPKHIELNDRGDTLVYTIEGHQILDKREPVVRAWREIQPGTPGAKGRRSNFEFQANKKAMLSFEYWGYEGIPVLLKSSRGSQPDAAFSIMILKNDDTQQWTQFEHKPIWANILCVPSDTRNDTLIIALTDNDSHIAFRCHSLIPKGNRTIILGSKILSLQQSPII